MNNLTSEISAFVAEMLFIMNACKYEFNELLKSS